MERPTVGEEISPEKMKLWLKSFFPEGKLWRLSHEENGEEKRTFFDRILSGLALVFKAMEEERKSFFYEVEPLFADKTIDAWEDALNIPSENLELDARRAIANSKYNSIKSLADYFYAELARNFGYELDIKFVPLSTATFTIGNTVLCDGHFGNIAHIHIKKENPKINLETFMNEFRKRKPFDNDVAFYKNNKLINDTIYVE